MSTGEEAEVSTVAQKGQHKQKKKTQTKGKTSPNKKESVLKKETVNKIEAQDARRECITQRKIKYNANKKAQRKQKSISQAKKRVSDRPARTPSVVLAVASHDCLTVRFLI